ncbi:hypothetical protein VCCP1050_1297, partial [Vibrio cholerae CP1050(23)]
MASSPVAKPTAAPA